ncbi:MULTISPECIES: RDD family protein [Butyricimonas]|uniref:RDD family protein n=1 Tax=Butyricimonas TaxID=574697 RepID=UPI001D064DA8|nr:MULTISPECIES: RDD family protein [Butyricimonas]MCB6973672.1 RDD family protein [Butyricimonas synergistica]MCG4520483.1 RDD family protein [Butyricimonas sp. DFI.6.44]
MNISINTAHNVAINYTPAGVTDRVLATIIDFAFLFGLLFMGAFVLGALNTFINMDWAIFILVLLLSLYHLICEYAFNGRSLGKFTMRLQVVKLNGKKLTFWDCMLRWIFRLIDITISSGAVALISIIVSKHTQRLGDLAAGTTVIRHERSVTLKQMSQYDAPEEYEVVFQQAALLSDKDIKIIKDVLREVNRNKNYNLLAPLAKKIKEVTGIETDMVPLDFVKTILKDYTRLANGND